MDSKKSVSLLTALRTSAGAILLGAASLTSAAPFDPIPGTWDPTAVGLGGSGAFTFDNIGLRQYAWIDVVAGAPTTFTENGFLSLNQFTNGLSITQTPATNATPYSLYVSFSGSGVQSSPTAPAFGTITS